MIYDPPKHARITVVPGCIVVEPIDCVIYTHRNGRVLIRIEELDIRSEAENLGRAAEILAMSLASAYDCLSRTKKQIRPCSKLRKQQEFLVRHLKPAI